MQPLDTFCPIVDGVAQPLHEQQQMQRHFTNIQIKTVAKPFANFLTECKVVNAANLAIALVRGISH